jgi:hypothetical protein
MVVENKEAVYKMGICGSWLQRMNRQWWNDGQIVSKKGVIRLCNCASQSLKGFYCSFGHGSVEYIPYKYR